MLRGGAGLFFPETALNVNASESYESPTVTRFARDGATVWSVTRCTHQLAALDTPSSLIWNVECFHTFVDGVFAKAHFMRRTADDKFILKPISSGGTGVLRPDTNGDSRYWELELTSPLLLGSHELNVSYVRSRSQCDLPCSTSCSGVSGTQSSGRTSSR